MKSQIYLINGEIEMKIKNEKLFIKIACLICSVILWIIVMIETNPMLEKPINNIPVTIKNLSALENSNMILMNADKNNLTVNVKVKGYREQINKIDKSDFTAYIDVLGFQEGTRNAKVEIVGPNGVEIQGPFPSQIACVVESIVSRVIDVTVQYEGKQHEDYYMDEGISNPSSVKITGPRSVVDSAQKAVATINVDGATGSVTKTVPVRVYSGTNTEIFMTVPTDNVKVSVPVYPTKYVEIKPKITGVPMEGYEVADVSVKPGKVKIAARKDILDTIRELEVQELDITGAFHNIMASKEILDNKDIIYVDLTAPPVVNVVVEKTIQKELSYNISDIKFTNIKEGYEFNVKNKDEIITVFVSGAASAVSGFAKEDLTLTADLANAVLGTNNIKIEKNTDKKLGTIALGKEVVEVEIIEKQSESAPQ